MHLLQCGGDEFYIICNETNQEKIEYQIKNMTNTLTEKRISESRLPTIAYGYSLSQEGKQQDFQTILNEADEQMYQFKKLYKAKAAGKLVL
jgi:diguanylate cyclase (GGDEF)-like protein